MDLASLPRLPDDPDDAFVPDLSEGEEGGLYLALLELLDEGLVITGDDLVLEVNSAACRLLERGYGELVGRPLADLFPSEQAFLAARERLLIRGEMRGSLQVALPDGRQRELRYCAAPRLRPGLHALILSPEQAGAPTDALWPQLAAVLDQPVVVLDEQERVAAANPAAQHRLGLVRAELLGRPLAERLSVRWPAPGEEAQAHLMLPGGDILAARLLPGPRPGWQLLVLPAKRPATPVTPARPHADPPPSPRPAAGLLQARRALEVGLARALAGRQLEIHFAPEWRLAAPSPAAEALLRWRHPELGLIPARRLLPVLRQSELLAGVCNWALAQACAETARWAAEGHTPPLVLNVAPEQLADPAFPTRVSTILRETGLSPETVELDLEEALMAPGDPWQLATLRKLADLGLGLAIDNFGLGLLSIPLLARMPLTRLRLAPAFVREGLTKPASLEATLAAARALGLQVAAKGVHNAAAQARLMALGCSALQGRHIGGPEDAASFSRRHLA